MGNYEEENSLENNPIELDNPVNKKIMKIMKNLI